MGLAVLLTLVGCQGQSRAAVNPDSALAAAAPETMPIVRFRLLIIRSWADPWYVIESEDADLTLPGALKMGLPAELWIKFLIEGPADFRHEIYWVRPVNI